MLGPETRVTLVETLRPPPGHTVDFAIGTSFTLDLQALLTAPAAFALIEATDERAAADAEPLELLDSIRRHADRLVVFCQAGQVSVPAQVRLLPYLERVVIPVSAPRGGVFHPKVWVMRYRDASGGRLRHRLLCSSRNLTFDSSWDTMLALDEAEGDDGIPLGRDVASFLRVLPTLALDELHLDTRARVEEVATSIDGLTFAPPEGVTGGRFIALGLNGGPPDSWPFEPTCERLAVVSPFLDHGLLARLPTANAGSTLVSRPEALNAVGTDSLRRFDEVFVLAPDSGDDRERNPESVGQPGQGINTARDPRLTLAGLHAKLFVVDRSDAGDTRVYTGSANATNAAFERNVEALIELSGPADRLGVQALLSDGPRGEVSFRALLDPYRVPEDAGDGLEGEPESPLDRARRALAVCSLQATVERDPTEPLDQDAPERYRTRYETTRAPELLPEVSIACWPVTRPRTWAKEPKTAPGGRLVVEFESDFERLTAFLAVRLRDAAGETEFVMPATVTGMPEDRSGRLLRSLLGTAERLLAYLLLLLSDCDSDLWSVQEALDRAQRPDSDFQPATGLPLLEAMLDAVHRDPRRVEHVHRVIEELRRSPAGGELLPETFDEVWSAVWSVAQGGPA